MAEEIESTETDGSEQEPNSQDKQSLELEEKLEILDARVLSFVLPSTRDKPRYSRDVEYYEFEIFTQPQSRSDNLFKVIVYVECDIVFKDKTVLKASVQSEVIFKLKADAEEKKKFVLKEQDTKVILSALSIAYSTTRGMMLSKSSGTILEKAVLPILAPSKLLVLPPSEIGGGE